jgi:hypothetical protein
MLPNRFMGCTFGFSVLNLYRRSCTLTYGSITNLPPVRKGGWFAYGFEATRNPGAEFCGRRDGRRGLF